MWIVIDDSSFASLIHSDVLIPSGSWQMTRADFVRLQQSEGGGGVSENGYNPQKVAVTLYDGQVQLHGQTGPHILIEFT
jgi:hypothetical protein